MFTNKVYGLAKVLGPLDVDFSGVINLREMTISERSSVMTNKVS
jgi:hypothetical protein